jgi:hypothetical protein
MAAVGIGFAVRPRPEGDERTVVLLVHGMTWHNEDAIDIWGSHVGDNLDGSNWNGMIGFLEDEAGYHFGGVVRATGSDIILPECLDTRGARFEPCEADLFSLEFSDSAKTDGLSYKTEELAECIDVLRDYTGAKRVKLVAHSAGGPVCRALLQSALPVAKYERGSVDRLLTIGAPHLGAGIASKLGDLLGTRATSLKPEADLMIRLNTTLDLPTDVDFASIVIRGFAADVRGEGKAYDHLVDRTLLSGLPLGYREGGDQVVHVRSQNLRLAKCARRFEEATGRPVHGILVRVSDPSPRDRSVFQETVHVAAPRDRHVQTWVARLLLDDNRYWLGLTATELAESSREQSHQTAFGCIEQKALQRHRLSEVHELDVETLEFVEEQEGKRRWRFEGRAKSRGMSILRRFKHSTWVKGTIELSFDHFGRITDSRSVAAVVRDE